MQGGNTDANNAWANSDADIFMLTLLAFGGARRDRTDDLKLAKLALSQLSYGPGSGRLAAASRSPRHATRVWWAWEDLNFRPHAYQARALTN